MIPTCFNVSVYQMDAKEQAVEKSANSSSKDDICIQDEAVKSIDTSFVDLNVVGNLAFTTEDVEAIQTVQASKSTDDFNTSVEEITDYDFSGTRVIPDVPFDSASSKENSSEIIVFLSFKMLVMIFPVSRCTT
jgi:hypothetical protein